MRSSAPLVIHQPNFNFDSVEKIHLLTYNWQSYYCKHTLCWSGVSMERSKSNLELDGNYTIKVGIHGWCTPVTIFWPFWLLLSTTNRQMTPVTRWSEYFVDSDHLLSSIVYFFLFWDEPFLPKSIMLGFELSGISEYMLLSYAWYGAAAWWTAYASWYWYCKALFFRLAFFCFLEHIGWSDPKL